MPTNIQTRTLRALRSEKGRSAGDLTAFLQVKLGEEKRRDPTSIYQMERDGTEKYSIIAAMAEFYELSIPEMAAIASPKNNRQ